jgi:hypothetical protein
MGFTIKFRDLLESLTWKKFFMTVFEFIGQFLYKMMFLNFKKSFQTMGSELYSLRRDWKLPDISYFTDFTDLIKTFQRQF